MRNIREKALRGSIFCAGKHTFEGKYYHKYRQLAREIGREIQGPNFTETVFTELQNLQRECPQAHFFSHENLDWSVDQIAMAVDENILAAMNAMSPEPYSSIQDARDRFPVEMFRRKYLDAEYKTRYQSDQWAQAWNDVYRLGKELKGSINPNHLAGDPKQFYEQYIESMDRYNLRSVAGKGALSTLSNHIHKGVMRFL